MLRYRDNARTTGKRHVRDNTVFIDFPFGRNPLVQALNASPVPARPSGEVVRLPLAVSLAAHDPTAGAGIAADMAAFAALGCQPAAVLTGLTVQDTLGVHRFEALSASWVEQQARVLLADMRPAVFKTGALCSADIVQTVADLSRAFPGVPWVMDPVMASGRGDALASTDLRDAFIRELIPRASVVTPNVPEALSLSGQATGADAAAWLLDRGAGAVLLTGTHDESTGSDVVNTLYRPGVLPVSYRCLRLPGSYHGSGCTLASSLAGFLARGQTIEAAVDGALRYTWETLNRATRPGEGQAIPDRQLGRFWTLDDFAGS